MVLVIFTFYFFIMLVFVGYNPSPHYDVVSWFVYIFVTQEETQDKQNGKESQYSQIWIS